MKTAKSNNWNIEKISEKLHPFVWNAELSETREGVERSIKELLSCCDNLLVGARYGKQMTVFCEVGNALSRFPGNDQIWVWLAKKAKRASPARRDVMRIALFEMIKEQPVIEQDIKKLWGLWDDKSTRWAVCAAYLNSKKIMKKHEILYGAGASMGKKQN